MTLIETHEWCLADDVGASTFSEEKQQKKEYLYTLKVIQP
jgi:hypothetical protein